MADILVLNLYQFCALYIRVMAVNSIRVLGQSPEAIAEAYNFNRACIYRWLRQYDEGGFAALESEMPSGAKPLVTGGMDEGMKQTALEKTPVDFGYDANLWTCAILAELLRRGLGVTVSESAARLQLKSLGLACQKPEYQDAERDGRETGRFLDVKFHRIQKLAVKPGAEWAWEQFKAGTLLMKPSSLPIP